MLLKCYKRCYTRHAILLFLNDFKDNMFTENKILINIDVHKTRT